MPKVTEEHREQMRARITTRVIQLADHVIATCDTVRGAAQKFGVSKSTVHKDITEKLKHINPALHEEVGKLLATNKSERNLRGGEATRQKFLKMKSGETSGIPKPQDDRAC